MVDFIAKCSDDRGRGAGLKLGLVASCAGLAILAGCAPKPKPAPPPPPPPVVIVIPPTPKPPVGAPENLSVPPMNDQGARVTVNSGISSVQALWNLRSAYNVAALNCKTIEYDPILQGYKRFLKIYAKPLDAANKEIDRSFQTQNSPREATVARDAYQTKVYNFFALPPVTSAFCDAAMQVTTELETVDVSQLENYAFVGLAKLEAPFKTFFDSYDQYLADLAAWEAKYGGNIIVRAPYSSPQAGQTIGQSGSALVGQQPFAQPSYTQPSSTEPSYTPQTFSLPGSSQ